MRIVVSRIERSSSLRLSSEGTGETTDLAERLADEPVNLVFTHRVWLVITSGTMRECQPLPYSSTSATVNL